MLRAHTEISWSQSTIRGNVYAGASRQGDWPTTNLKGICPRLLFFCAFRLLSDNRSPKKSSAEGIRLLMKTANLSVRQTHLSNCLQTNQYIPYFHTSKEMI